MADVFRYYAVDLPTDAFGGSTRKSYRSRERATEAMEAHLREHGARLLRWPLRHAYGTSTFVDTNSKVLTDVDGDAIFPGSGCALDQRVVDGTLRVERHEDGSVSASAEIEWREVRCYTRTVEVVVDGLTYTRPERVCEVTRDWQPLCRRLLFGGVERVRAERREYVCERTIEFADGEPREGEEVQS